MEWDLRHLRGCAFCCKLAEAEESHVCVCVGARAWGEERERERERVVWSWIEGGEARGGEKREADREGERERGGGAAVLAFQPPSAQYSEKLCTARLKQE